MAGTGGGEEKAWSWWLGGGSCGGGGGGKEGVGCYEEVACGPGVELGHQYEEGEEEEKEGKGRDL